MIFLESITVSSITQRKRQSRILSSVWRKVTWSPSSRTGLSSPSQLKLKTPATSTPALFCTSDQEPSPRWAHSVSSVHVPLPTSHGDETRNPTQDIVNEMHSHSPIKISYIISRFCPRVLVAPHLATASPLHSAGGRSAEVNNRATRSETWINIFSI